eukprot:CAMPEP_0171529322 /NCGR_PEP_ID=MMETSP0959-20130129/12291_1 /TAXON_ID=87120 /ORGANISM="Aurantiochytrium limacinum, Strain ATCCMYA-1381" /LENGTH=263 /DNA_ID=CAMNT_0012071657 /DNA_START=220 /DNA_END=1011 /DNA_ORIENTATION=-
MTPVVARMTASGGVTKASSRTLTLKVRETSLVQPISAFAARSHAGLIRNSVVQNIDIMTNIHGSVWASTTSRGLASKAQDFVTGKAIQAPNGMVRFIDEKGVNHGVVPLENALAAAKKANMELLQLKPANPDAEDINQGVPICKCMDVSKYKYDLQRKMERSQQQARVHAKQNTIKELKFGTNIEENDLHFKIDRAQAFLKKGYQVRVTIVLRRSAVIAPEQRKQRAFEILRTITEQFNGFGKESAQERKILGGSVRTTFTPN